MFGEVTSALQKSIRRGQEEDAAFWAIELHQSGFGEYLWHRLKIITSEDIGLAEPQMPAVIHALYESSQMARKRRNGGDGLMYAVHAALLLARARKSRIVDHAMIALLDETQPRPIPDVALDVHTVAGRQRGRGWSHFFEEAGLLADRGTGELGHGCLPDPYEERARAALERSRRPQTDSQMQLDQEDSR